MAQKKIVIMTVPFGGGHHATAETVQALLKEADQSLDIEIIDAVTEAWPAFSRYTTAAYVQSTASPGGMWFKLYYRLSDRWPQPLQWIASPAYMRYARRRIKQLKPDLIIATFPFLGHIASAARNAEGMSCPVVTMVTDAGHVQGIWLYGREDYILPATPDTVTYAKRRRVRHDKLRFIGFPVKPEFHISSTPTEARRELGLDEKFTVLVTAGGLGMNPKRVLAFARELQKINQPMQIIFIAGKNSTLQDNLAKLKFKPEHTIHIHGFTSRMAELMRAADIVCSKAGWLTISEALSVGRPLVLFDAIPGHEEQNAQHVVRHHYGVYEKDPARAARFVAEAAASTTALQPYQRALKGRGHQAEVPKELAKFYLGLMK